MSESKTCEELSRGSTWHRYACGKRAKFFEKKWGKEQWFCGMHAPSEKIRRDKERRAEHDRVMGPIWDARAKAECVREAAPELLEALKALLIDLEGHCVVDGRLTAAERAIAKAEGRS